jgi:hypothetical protein
VEVKERGCLTNDADYSSSFLSLFIRVLWGCFNFCLLPVLVHSGCYSKMPYTGSFIRCSNLLLTDLETGKAMIKEPEELCLVRTHFSQMKPSPVTLAWQEWQTSSFECLFYKGTESCSWYIITS